MSCRVVSMALFVLLCDAVLGSFNHRLSVITARSLRQPESQQEAIPSVPDPMAESQVNFQSGGERRRGGDEVELDERELVFLGGGLGASREREGQTGRLGGRKGRQGPNANKTGRSDSSPPSIGKWAGRDPPPCLLPQTGQACGTSCARAPHYNYPRVISCRPL